MKTDSTRPLKREYTMPSPLNGGATEITVMVDLTDYPKVIIDGAVDYQNSDYPEGQELKLTPDLEATILDRIEPDIASDLLGT